MKLHEASTVGHAQYTRRAMDILKSVKSDATGDNLMWYAANYEAEVSGDWSTRDTAWMFVEGVKPLKDPEVLNDFWEREFEYLDQDYDRTEADKILTYKFKEFFEV